MATENLGKVVGKDGVTFTPVPFASENTLTLSWTNDGSAENPKPVSISASGSKITTDGVYQEVFETNSIKAPNPYKIIFNGAVSGEYDGSKELTITIPDGGVIPKTGAYYISHRGKSTNADVIENILLSYETSGYVGYWGAEADISETSDGSFVLMHDATVDRTTIGSGYVKDKILYNIISFDIIDIGQTTYQGSGTTLRVPTLQDFLAICLQYKMNPIIEIKNISSISSVDSIINIAKQYTDVFTIISFDMEQLIRARSIDETIGLHFLKSSPPTAEEVQQLLDYNLVFSSNYNNYSGSWVDELIGKGIDLGAYTVNEVETAQSLENRGVKYITTDVLTDSYYAKNEIKNATIKAEHMMWGKWSTESVMNIFESSIFDTSLNRIRSGLKTVRGVNYVHRVATGDTLYNATVMFYDKYGNMLDDIGWVQSGTTIAVPAMAFYANIYASKISNADFTQEELISIPAIEFSLWK